MDSTYTTCVLFIWPSNSCLVAGARRLKICAMSAVNQDVRCLWSVWASCWHIGRLKVWRPENSKNPKQTKRTVSPKIEESKTKLEGILIIFSDYGQKLEKSKEIQFSIISSQFRASFRADFFWVLLRGPGKTAPAEFAPAVSEFTTCLWGAVCTNKNLNEAIMGMSKRLKTHYVVIELWRCFKTHSSKFFGIYLVIYIYIYIYQYVYDYILFCFLIGFLWMASIFEPLGPFPTQAHLQDLAQWSRPQAQRWDTVGSSLIIPCFLGVNQS